VVNPGLTASRKHSGSFMLDGIPVKTPEGIDLIFSLRDFGAFLFWE
jgi:hypothetical protein